jgi:hypothetical protein
MSAIKLYNSRSHPPVHGPLGGRRVRGLGWGKKLEFIFTNLT